MIVACVEHGDYLGRGREYVDKLKSMVSRNLRQPFTFVCLTDDRSRHDRLTWWESLPPGLPGWWNKISLFKPGMFPAGARVLYVDLDTVIAGTLDDFAASRGIIHLRNWGWDRDVYGSGTMVWDAGEYEEIWTRRHEAAEMIAANERAVGDQEWITKLGGWPALPPHLVKSYRYHAKEKPPEGCSVVCFHGPDKPHLLPPDNWARRIWDGS